MNCLKGDILLKKAIVTGANGFVGSAVCRELIEQGVEVIAVVRNNVDSISDLLLLKGIRIIYCDMANIFNLVHLIDDRDVDVLYHFAWTGSSGILRQDSDNQINNIKYTCNIVKVCSELCCRRFVFASSVMVYEIQAAMTSESIPNINTLYSTAKLSADYMARTMSNYYGIEYITAIISNIYGPGENSPRLINTSIRKMLNGEHCSFSLGEQLYDFIYITDAAKFFVGIGNKGKPYKNYYIGSLYPKPLKYFLKSLRDCVDPEIEIGLGEIPFNGKSLSYTEFDIFSVKNDIGLIPIVSFEEGIKNTIKWIKEEK